MRRQLITQAKDSRVNAELAAERQREAVGFQSLQVELPAFTVGTLTILLQFIMEI